MSSLLEAITLHNKYENHYLVYTRKSTDDTKNQKNSISYQIQKNRAYAKANKLPVAALTHAGFCKDGIIREHHSGYKDDARFEILEDGSVKHSVDRPKFLKLIELLLQGQFKGVIVNCWDRLSRNETDDNLIKKLLKQGIDIRFVETAYERSSAGALHMDIDGMFSRHYSRSISEKVRNAAKKLRREGRCIYPSPLGYLDQGSDNKPFDPERAPIVRRLFELYGNGQWSYASLAKWANKEGLTTKPRRRKRTREEMLLNMDAENLPKTCRPVTSKQIENILKNPFYMGVNVHNPESDKSIAHEPMVSKALFYKVQEVMSKRTAVVHYPEKQSFAYRGLIRCTGCKRRYSPYIKKGHTYYTSRCKTDCNNTQKTLSEKRIDALIGGVIERIHFSDDELHAISRVADKQLKTVSDRRNKALLDLQKRHKRILEDLDYLLQERISFIRKGIMSMEETKDEEYRLKEELSQIEHNRSSYDASTRQMLEFVVTFSNLIRYSLQDYRNFQMEEKREVVQSIFSELFVKDKKPNYRAKEGFHTLLERFSPHNEYFGCPNYLFSELEQLYTALKAQRLHLSKTLLLAS